MAYARARGHHRHLGALLVVLSIGACATSGEIDRGGSPEPESSGSAERIVALDFVTALGQLQDYGPFETIVGLDRDAVSDTFLTAMREVLLEQGYGVRLVGAGATDVLRYRRLDGGTERDGTARRETYEIALDAVEMRRDYAFSAEGGVSPSSPLYVRGVDASALETDDSIFAPTIAADEPSTGAAEPAVVGAGTGEPSADGERPGIEAARARSDEDDTTRPGLPGERPESRRPPMSGERRSITVPDGGDVNMFDLGVSNYDDLFADYVNVDETILVFAYDSLVLGQRNERRVRAMADAYEPERDVFSVIGCSLGATDIAGGNAALALGRAGRVREALLFAGVDRERILDEGCWSEEEGAMNLPTRGVILTLKRRRG